MEADKQRKEEELLSFLNQYREQASESETNLRLALQELETSKRETEMRLTENLREAEIMSAQREAELTQQLQSLKAEKQQKEEELLAFLASYEEVRMWIHLSIHPSPHLSLSLSLSLCACVCVLCDIACSGLRVRLSCGRPLRIWRRPRKRTRSGSPEASWTWNRYPFNQPTRTDTFGWACVSLCDGVLV